MEWLILSAIGAALMFSGNKNKSKKTNSTDSNVNPDPLDIDTMMQASPSNSDSASKTSKSDASLTIKNSGIPKYGAPTAVSKNNSGTGPSSNSEKGKAIPYLPELADGFHVVVLKQDSVVNAISKDFTSGFHKLKQPVPKGTVLGYFRGSTYTSSKGTKYLMSSGYYTDSFNSTKSDCYLLVDINNANISSVVVGKPITPRLIVNNLLKGEFTILK